MKKGILVLLIGVLAMQAVPAGQSAPVPAAPEGRRDAVRMMEAVLSRAVLGGAERLAERLGNGSNPNVSFFTGQARAHGFLLEGYGVFFHVEIPGMQGSLVMSVTTLDRDLVVAGTLESLRRTVGAFPEGASKLEAEQLLKRLQAQVGPLPQVSQAPSQPSSGVIQATGAATAPIADGIPSEPVPMIRDPHAAYRDAIKSALIDAMLDYSRGLNIQPDEWLTVAANRGDAPLPDEIVNSPTLVLRIKGSDLTIYEADRTKRDEIRKRVEVREF